jgi:transposase
MPRALESILLGLPRYEITHVEGGKEIHLGARYRGPPQECPRCGGTRHWIQDRFLRTVRHENWGLRRVYLELEVRKLRCRFCNHYFRERFWGLLPWKRSTEPFRRQIVWAHREGISQKTLSDQEDLGHATIERWSHELLEVKSRERELANCPRIMGIDEHFFGRGLYSTTMADLEHPRVFELFPGRSQEALKPHFDHLLGRDQVQLVWIDLSRTYRALVKEYFPHAQIVADRFHVIRLVIRAFRKTWMAVDEKGITQAGLRRALKRHPQNLEPEEWARLSAYLKTHDIVRLLYDFKNELCRLFKIKHRTRRQCRALIPRLLEATRKLRDSKFEFLITLGKTLEDWKEEIARMWRYTRSNGTTEGFHTKMEMIQRRAYGFRNFENYRLRVRLLCGG